MSYNTKNYYDLRREYEEKRTRAAADAEARKAEVLQKIDGMNEVETALASTAVRIMGAAFEGREGLSLRIEKIKEETAALRQVKEQLLVSAGYPRDYTDIKYQCPECLDTGFKGTKMCKCFRRALTLRGYETSGVGRLVAKQSFETFSLDYYKYDPAVYGRMSENLNRIKAFADSFDPLTSPSLLFMGGTGLGKTHLQSALAKAVIDRGYDAHYESASHMFNKYEAVKFKGAEEDVSVYTSAELLILDDLGTELGGAFTNACLYDLINTRLVLGLPTVISTNLDAPAISARYGERIFSRLFGEYQPLVFCGSDIRAIKT